MTRADAGTAAAPRTEGASGRVRPQESTTHTVYSEEDLLHVRHAVRAATVLAGFGIVDQTRVVTAASELARNAYVHGGGGTLTVEIVRRLGTTGLRLTVKDDGPGIADVEAALTDGFTTGAGLGHGLGGARRLMDDFTLRTEAGRGTVVTAVRWHKRRA
ncbi:ATP-binding protein [Streptomyces sp. AN091965]|uniref:ATP-binding protein n=1 Tax=Streptomyces sp. AN091965 TaxID=2927803 RepID=UPI001F601263|nr:ATP-binding protein [Streptomyces sp. AN091965]MCI3934568.1 ATP-binding protein [Streptomyces sp. AN091965]